MQMEIEAAGDRLTARIKGELDHHSAAQARAQLDALLTDERIRELRIDLRGLTFMDSSGIAVLLRAYRRLGELGVTEILEVGPGKALSGFVKKTLGPDVPCTAVETAEELAAFLTKWKEAHA